MDEAKEIMANALVYRCVYSQGIYRSKWLTDSEEHGGTLTLLLWYSRDMAMEEFGWRRTTRRRLVKLEQALGEKVDSLLTGEGGGSKTEDKLRAITAEVKGKHGVVEVERKVVKRVKELEEVREGREDKIVRRKVREMVAEYLRSKEVEEEIRGFVRELRRGKK